MAQPLLKNCPAAESDPGAHAPARHKADSCCSFFAWLAYSNSAGLRLRGHFTFFILEPQSNQCRRVGDGDYVRDPMAWADFAFGTGYQGMVGPGGSRSDRSAFLSMVGTR